MTTSWLELEQPVELIDNAFIDVLTIYTEGLIMGHVLIGDDIQG